MSDTVFFNEIHYDNVSGDIDEGFELAGLAGTDLSGWKVILYNGNGGAPYATIALEGVIPDQDSGYGTLSFAYPGIQNGAPDGFALVDGDGNVLQFLSYEGSFTAVGGEADGMTSTDIAVEEGSATPVGYSLQLTGTGTAYEDFTWASEAASTFGDLNNAQSFGAPLPAVPGTLSIADASVTAGDAGTSDLVFTVTRDGGSDGAVSASWTLALGSADAADLATSTFTGTVAFADGETSATITIPVAGDTAIEGDETVALTLSDPTGGADLGTASATGTIVNDDGGASGSDAIVFINEIHYDNTSSDVGEGIEVAGLAGTDLTGWSLVLYNGNGGGSYATYSLSGVIADQANGYGTVSVLTPGIQNGSPDGVALVDAAGQVVQFLSYEGTMTATSGPASGMTSTDIGVAEDPAPAAGFSLQLKGTGSVGDDFVWSAASADSFGAVNAGQSFLSPTDTGHLRVDDTSVVEGDAGTSDLVFTIHRAGGSANVASVDYAIDTSGISADDISPLAQLTGTVTFGVGEYVKTVSIPVAGDTVGELNETVTLTLSNPVGDVVIDDADATGTIVNDDPIALSIMQIQGAGHYSDYVGQSVLSTGIVTAVDANGFYMQDATGDGDAATSDGIFVFTGSAPSVVVGDGVSVSGVVSEYAGDDAGLPLTEITAPTVTVESQGNALPEAVVIGADGILPPTATIDDDGLSVFDPASDGIDFWEALEGMRVTIEDAQAVGNTNTYGETWAVADNGAGATGINERGGITLSEGDNNPERVIITADSDVFAGYNPDHTVGDQLGDVTGVLTYGYDTYRLVVTEDVSVANDTALARETTSLAGDAHYLSMATYNVENLDVTDNKFDVLAKDIVYNLNAPDIVALQEIQDADGAGSGSNLSGTVTAQGLIDAIYAETGMTYAYVEVAPDSANTSGGEPNGNIRSGYLYNVDRVDYVEGSATLIEGDAYTNSRSPLVAEWEFAGSTVTTVNVHFYSRGGSDEAWGSSQPAVAAGDERRTAQAAGVKDYVTGLLAADPTLNIAILGDWNGFYWEDAQTQLTDPGQGGVFTNLSTLIEQDERYSYYYEGNSQQIDHILVTGGLLENAQYDAVHINAEFDNIDRPTDHDPQVALLMLGQAPSDLVLSHAEVAENMPAGTVVGTLSATDSANDTLTYALTDDAGGLFVVDPETGIVTTTAALDHEAMAAYTLTATATDSAGLATSAEFAVGVGDVNEAPVGVADAVAIDEDATSANLWSQLLGNDQDPDAGDTLAISAVDTTGTLGTVSFDAASHTLTYAADNDAFDYLATGETATDSFTYTVTDADGLSSTAVVTLTVTAIADGVVEYGTLKSDVITGTAGEDKLYGGFGKDQLCGLDGHDELHGGFGADLLDGGAGNDALYAGMGNDTMTGGSGHDSFHFGWVNGHNTVTDFDVTEDTLVLEDGVWIVNSRVRDVDHDGIDDLVLTLGCGTSVTLLGVSELDTVSIAGADEQHGFAFGTLLDNLAQERAVDLAHGF